MTIFLSIFFFQKLVQKAKDEKWNVWTLEGGLETLTSKLSQRLQKDGVTIKMSGIGESNFQGDGWKRF